MIIQFNSSFTDAFFQYKSFASSRLYNNYILEEFKQFTFIKLPKETLAVT